MLTARELARWLGLHKSGAGWRGACPACGHRDTFLVRQRAGRPAWRCVSCEDQDAITAAVQRAVPDARPMQPTAPDAAAAARKTERAIALWNGSAPVPGTPAERLAGRGLPELAHSAALRFWADTPHPDRGRLPALIALVQDVTGKRVAAHRTFLSHYGKKADCDPPNASLGSIGGAAIRLHPVAEEIVIGEGMETAASAGRLLGLPAWAGIAAGNMAHRLALPDQVRRVVIAADADALGKCAASGAGWHVKAGRCASRGRMSPVRTSTTFCWRAGRRRKGRMPDGFTMHDAPDVDPADLRLRAITCAELFTTDFPPREHVLTPWLPTKGLAMLFGPRGIGKTHLTLGIAYAIASGGSFLGWQAPRPRPVLIIDGEMPATVLKERLVTIAGAAPIEPPSPDFLRLLPMDLQERGLDLSDPEHQRQLDALLDGAEVLLVDNISTLVSGGRENEAESWLPVQQWALAQRRAGRTVLFVHHAGKGGQQRGTSRREDVLDTVIGLRKPADYQPEQGCRFEFHYEKARGFHGDDAKPFEATLGAGGWTTRGLADVDMARVVHLTGDGLSVRDIAQETGFSRSRVSRLQRKAKEAGILRPDAAGNA